MRSDNGIFFFSKFELLYFSFLGQWLSRPIPGLVAIKKIVVLEKRRWAWSTILDFAIEPKAQKQNLTKLDIGRQQKQNLKNTREQKGKQQKTIKKTKKNRGLSISIYSGEVSSPFNLRLVYRYGGSCAGRCLRGPVYVEPRGCLWCSGVLGCSSAETPCLGQEYT